MRRLTGLILVSATFGVACGGTDSDRDASEVSDVAITAADVSVPASEVGDVATTAVEVSVSVSEQLFPDIIDATAEQTNLGWTFNATVSSPYDTADRYADAWRIVGPDGTVYGTRELAHDHAAEQPFTRTIQAVEIPEDVEVVTIEGRDQDNGWGGGTFEVTLIRS